MAHEIHKICLLWLLTIFENLKKYVYNWDIFHYSALEENLTQFYLASINKAVNKGKTSWKQVVNVFFR